MSTRLTEQYKLVAVGGTFDNLHEGHKAIIREACRIGKHVIIGLVSDSFARSLKPHPVDSFNARKQCLEEFLKEEGLDKKVEIKSIDDPYGPTLYSSEIDAIVISEETKARALEINRLRKIKGLNPLSVICVDMVLAEDGLPITTTRIRKGEINRKGKAIKGRS